MADVVELFVGFVVQGAGTALGAFLGTRLVIHRLEGLISKLKNGGVTK